MSRARAGKETLTINRMLKLLRNIEGVSAKELAGELGFSPAYISELETGKKAPTLRVLNAYGQYFGIRPATLLDIQEEALEGSNAELVVLLLEGKAEADRLGRKTVTPAQKAQRSALQPT
jgi:transcriptional regulator with XRE-family HTH domain